MNSAILSDADPMPIVAFVLIFGLGVGSIAWTFRRSSTLLQRWAQRNGFQIVSSEYRWLARGPFWWRTSKSQSVYRVEVIDAQGVRRKGYVRVGGWLGGLWSDVAAVEWDSHE